MDELVGVVYCCDVVEIGFGWCEVCCIDGGCVYECFVGGGDVCFG